LVEGATTELKAQESPNPQESSNPATLDKRGKEAFGKTHMLIFIFLRKGQNCPCHVMKFAKWRGCTQAQPYVSCSPITALHENYGEWV